MRYNIKCSYNSILIILCSTILLSSCASLKKLSEDNTPQNINIQMIVSPEVNPDLNKIPSPIRIDILELLNAKKFNNFNYLDILNDEMIGDDLIKRRQYIMSPDNILHIPVELDKNTKFVAVTGGYLDIDNSNWKLTLLRQDEPWLDDSKNYLYIYIDKLGIYQLSKSQMKQALKDYAIKHPDNSKVKKNGKIIKPKPDYSKGIFTENN